MNTLFSIAYLPPVHYFSELLRADAVVLEKHEHFVKQTYRNRCVIAAANGPLSLTIPLQKISDKEKITAKKISYAENWQQLHWRSITSAYKSSPYFEYFESDFRPFYETRHELLFDYNLELLKLICKLLRVELKFGFTEEYNAVPAGCVDLRNAFHPKEAQEINVNPYYQVFADKNGFIPNLSIIDLLFNEGLGAVEYCTRLESR